MWLPPRDHHRLEERQRQGVGKVKGGVTQHHGRPGSVGELETSCKRQGALYEVTVGCKRDDKSPVAMSPKSAPDLCASAMPEWYGNLPQPSEELDVLSYYYPRRGVFQAGDGGCQTACQFVIPSRQQNQAQTPWQTFQQNAGRCCT